jgi:hypothetical protein
VGWATDLCRSRHGVFSEKGVVGRHVQEMSSNFITRCYDWIETWVPFACVCLNVMCGGDADWMVCVLGVVVLE